MTRTIVLVLALAACGGEKQSADPATGSAAPTTTASGSATKVATQPTAAGDQAGELVHAGDRKALQGFFANDLAVGGGYVYFVEQLRIDKHGTKQSTIRRKPTSDIAVAAEDVAGPMHVFGIAADDQAVYLTGLGAVRSKPHAGGELKELAKGNWNDVYSGDKHLLLRDGNGIALVPKGGGPLEIVSKNKNMNHAVAADGDRFYVIEHTIESGKAPSRAIMVYEPGQPSRKLVEAAEVRSNLGVEGTHVYFSGKADSGLPAEPLWRVPTTGGTPEPVGDRSWGFGRNVIRKGTLYGMVFIGKWKLRAIPLAGGKDVLLDDMKSFSGMVTALAADDKHLYYLTDWNVLRAPL